MIIEIGSFVGKSAVLLAGARKLQGSGQVHCIDPFVHQAISFGTVLSAGGEASKRIEA